MEKTLAYARSLDKKDELANFRDQFHFPVHQSGRVIYLNGNSLGLQPKNVKDAVEKELQDWRSFGVEGHFKGDTPWVSYHELLAEPMASIVGCKPLEVVMMNTLTVNLHLMMISFYNPSPDRYKILIEYSTFPSDRYAVKSQIKLHGYDPDDALIELKPDDGEFVSMSTIREVLEKNGEEIALLLIGGVNYYTGQVYDIEEITKIGHNKGCLVGFDLAHAVGNVALNLHEWGVDFAVWCTYKYLNSGPGSVGGCFVHEKHSHSNRPRLEGWWGHDKATRFLMPSDFNPMPGAAAWQLSNPPILSLAAVKASLELFYKVGMEKLISKSRKLIDFARYLLADIDHIQIISPSESKYRGCQLSIVLEKGGKFIHKELNQAGVYCDWREPNVIRVAFVPFYNSFEDVFHFTEILTDLI